MNETVHNITEQYKNNTKKYNNIETYEPIQINTNNTEPCKTIQGNTKTDRHVKPPLLSSGKRGRRKKLELFIHGHDTMPTG